MVFQYGNYLVKYSQESLLKLLQKEVVNLFFSKNISHLNSYKSTRKKQSNYFGINSPTSTHIISK